MPSTTTRRGLRAAVGIVAAAGLTCGLIVTAPTAEARRPAPRPTPGAGAFERVATMPAYLNGKKSEAAVAEISTVTPDGRTVVYTDSAGKRIGFVDIRVPGKPKPRGTVAVGGEPTSVYATGNKILVCVDRTDGKFSSPKGVLLVLDARTRTLLRQVDLGGQPDSIDVSPDGRWATIAIENQRDEEATPKGGDEGDLPQTPAGYLASIRLDSPVKTWRVKRTPLTGLRGMVAPTDPEPEYVKISPNGRYTALTLQENNQIAIIDHRRQKVVKTFSAGTATVKGVDVKKDKVINPTGSITAPREPDSIGWIDNRYVATANEGDWKGGTRAWTIFDSRTGKVVWDAGNSLERHVIDNGNWPEARAEKKGVEPEGLAVATFQGRRYAFVGTERANVVAVYDVSNPAQPKYLQMLASTNGPEGILPIPSRNLLVVSSEVDEAENNIRASVQLYRLTRSSAQGKQAQLRRYPQITANKRIGWGALGALTADPRKPGRLWSVTDSAYANTRILTIDATARPARITGTIPVTKAGKQASYDVEGIWRKRDGKGFWLGVEGETGPENRLVETDARGAVLREVTIPAGYAAKLGKQGIEGVSGSTNGKVLYVAFQREAKGEDVTRIGRYDIAKGSWTFYGYRLGTTKTKGDWLGLSEVTTVNGDTLAVIERDKMNGPDAKVKRIYTVKLTSKGVADGQKLPVLAKRLAVDVLPTLRAGNGWTQEKLEGMTIDRRGNVYVVTDNDGVKDATGETVFANLGRVIRR
ncbi:MULTISPECIES: esterase-like activity of phytase family protein [unclassified Luteococcus]|uniref:esterase-like activity of phytase family protein n=1 Tax=unclassified Luteococcus TaxID=2639923 RepID=UPI00313BAC62